MDREQRSFRRMPLEADVAFQELSFEKEAQSVQTRYKDVSAGGLLLTSRHQCQLGTMLKLEIRVPGWGKHRKATFESLESLHQDWQRPLVAIGKVVRIEALENGRFELGVQFLNVYPDDLQALMAFVDSSDSTLTNHGHS